MSCDEAHYRHFHKRVTHRHSHKNDLHHQHTHSGGSELAHKKLDESEHADHFHEHTHEVLDHEHLTENDPLHPHIEHSVEKDKKGTAP